MLAIKLVLADRDRVQTYVFDEVDAGIGGVTADTVGLALAEVALHRQVLCITHLPGIAAFADHHFRVAKSDLQGRTHATIVELSDKERTEELARMIGGAKVTKTTRAAAAELLAGAKKRRRNAGAKKRRRKLKPKPKPKSKPKSKPKAKPKSKPKAKPKAKAKAKSPSE